MKIAYFDCSMGIAGNMIIGSLLDAGLDPVFLEKEHNKLKLSGYKLKIEKTTLGTHFDVELTDKGSRRTVKEILAIIDQSKLEKKVKYLSKKIFLRLAQAECIFHKTKIDELHLHELGSTDAIIDIVGTVIGLNKLGIKEVYFSPINLGSGTIKFSHGVFTVPAPAVKELVKGFKVYSSEIKKEMTTPTGAAIITTIGKQFDSLPYLKLDKIGYGIGSYKLKEPDVLKVFIGEKVFVPGKESVFVIETEIDDMNPQFYDYIIKKLIKSGALDAFVTPIIMKKNRPGALLTIICKENITNKLCKIAFKETTTFGVRIYQADRQTLKREIKNIKTIYGNIRVKIGYLNDEIVSVSPEYEDVAKAAEKSRIPIKLVYDEAKITSFQKLL